MASIKLFELGGHMPGCLFLGVWYAGGIDFRCTPSVPIFGIISDLLEATKPTNKYARVYIECLTTSDG